MRLPMRLQKWTLNPAKILNIDAGHLSTGAAADVCIFDPDRDWKVEAAALKSQGKNTPFSAWKCRAKSATPWSMAGSYIKQVKRRYFLHFTLA